MAVLKGVTDMQIQNEYLLIEVADHGAELMRIYDKSRGIELLWNGDPTFWGRRSPVLFPNVGKTWNNTMLIDGTSYPTSQHGFARDRDFECVFSSGEKLSYLLRSDEQTRTRYPFDFELQIDYTLNGKELDVCWTVMNCSDRKMSFAIGGHPAFMFEKPGETKHDYCLVFPALDRLTHVSLDLSKGCAKPDQSFAIELQDHALPLSDELFANDALILDNCQIEEAWLCRADRTPLIGMRSVGFPNYGIWSVKGAPFVCLEPWAGRCDDCGFDKDFSQKNNINILQPSESIKKAYQILIP